MGLTNIFSDSVKWLFVGALLAVLVALLLYFAIGCNRISVQIVGARATVPAATVVAVSTSTPTTTSKPTTTPTFTQTPTVTSSATSSPTATATETSTATLASTATPTLTSTPNAALTAAAATLRARQTLTAQAAANANQFEGMYLRNSGTDENGTNFYIVQFRDPARETTREKFKYVWELILPGGAPCESARGAWHPNTPTPWQADWAHPGCTHIPDQEFVTVVVTASNGEQQRLVAPALPAGEFPIVPE